MENLCRSTFPIVEALERSLSDSGIAVFMCNATDDPERERRHIDQLLGAIPCSLKGAKVLWRILIFLALCCGSPATAFAADPLNFAFRAASALGLRYTPQGADPLFDL